VVAANEYLGQRVSNEHGFSIAAYKRRQIRLFVAVVKTSCQLSRFGKDTLSAVETAESAM
jgi:hypothetical protein